MISLKDLSRLLILLKKCSNYINQKFYLKYIFRNISLKNLINLKLSRFAITHAKYAAWYNYLIVVTNYLIGQLEEEVEK